MEFLSDLLAWVCLEIPLSSYLLEDAQAIEESTGFPDGSVCPQTARFDNQIIYATFQGEVMTIEDGKIAGKRVIPIVL